MLRSLWARLGNSDAGRELQSLLPLSLPIMIQSTLGQLLNIADLFFVGNFLGPEFLAAAALGNLYFNVLSALYMGAASALDEACAEAFAEGKPRVVGILAQRGMVLMTVTAILVMVGFSGTEGFLRGVLGQERDLSATAAGFVDTLLLGTLPHIASIAISRVLWAQGVVWAPIAVDVVANILNVSLNAALIEVDGFLGAPLATSLSRASQLALLVAYLWRWKPHLRNGTWTGWDARAALGDRAGVLSMTKAAVVGSVLFALEAWPVEFSTALAGRIDVPSLDAHTVVLNTCIFISLGLPLGMSVAASARIPRLLEAGDGPGAQRTAVVATVATVTYNLVCALLLLLGRWSMGRVFTSNAEVAEQCAAVAAVAALFQLVDGIQSVLGGILRGLGYEKGVSAVMFLGWAAVGLPLAATFAFSFQLGTAGLWAGLLCGVGSICVVHMGVYLTVNWDKAALRASRASRERRAAAVAAAEAAAVVAAAAAAADGELGGKAAIQAAEREKLVG